MYIFPSNIGKIKHFPSENSKIFVCETKVKFSDRKGLIFLHNKFSKKFNYNVFKKICVFKNANKNYYILSFGSEAKQKHKSFCLSYLSAVSTILGQGLIRSYKKMSVLQHYLTILPESFWPHYGNNFSLLPFGRECSKFALVM